jgi:hypothetical protein
MKRHNTTPKMCNQTTHTCPLCDYSSKGAMTLCLDAELWGRACKPFKLKEIPVLCSDECKEKSEEVEQWVKAKRARDALARLERRRVNRGQGVNRDGFGVRDIRLSSSLALVDE